MIACTSPAGTCSVTPFKIGLPATVACRFEMSSILFADVLPGRAIGQEVAAHGVGRVLTNAFKHALVVQGLLPVLKSGVLQVELLLELLLLGESRRRCLAQCTPLIVQRQAVVHDRL